MPKKNVLALLSAVLGAVLVGACVWTRGEPLPVLGATIAVLAAVTWGLKPSSRRNTLWLLTVAAGSAGLFFYYDSFWGLFAAGLAFVCGALMLWPTMDGVMPAADSPAPEAAVGRALHAVGVRLHCPQYLKDRIA